MHMYTHIFTYIYIYTYTFVINFSKNKFPYGPLSKNKSTWLLNFQGRLFINHEKHQTYTLNRMCFIECKGRITNVHHEHLNPKIDLTENLKKPPINLMVKTMVSGSKFPANQLTDFCWLYQTLKKIDEWFTRVLVEFHISIVLVPIRIPWTHNMPIVSIINGFFPWFTNEFPSVSHMFSISFPYVFQLSDIFLGFLMVFSWFSHGFPMIFRSLLAADDWNAQGPSLCGKSRIMQTLTQALTEDKAPHKLVVMNPKARCMCLAGSCSTSVTYQVLLLVKMNKNGKSCVIVIVI